MSDRTPCARCGILLHTGEGRITVSFTVDDLDRLVRDTTDPNMQDRLLCAIGVLDQAREQALRRDLTSS